MIDSPLPRLIPEQVSRNHEDYWRYRVTSALEKAAKAEICPRVYLQYAAAFMVWWYFDDKPALLYEEKSETKKEKEHA
jgi:hypothetical protein